VYYRAFFVTFEHPAEELLHVSREFTTHDLKVNGNKPTVPRTILSGARTAAMQCGATLTWSNSCRQWPCQIADLPVRTVAKEFTGKLPHLLNNGVWQLSKNSVT